MSSHKKRRSRKAKPIKEKKPPVSDRLHSLRQRIWGASALAGCVEYASDSKRVPTHEKPDIVTTMILLHDHLSDIAGNLGDIVDELGGPPDAVDESSYPNTGRE